MQYKTVSDLIADYLSCMEKTWPRIIQGNFDPRNVIMDSSSIAPCDTDFLIIRKYNLHDIDYEVYQKLPIILLDTQKYQVNFDHYFYWAFGADVLQHSLREKKDLNAEILERFFLLMDFIFSSSYNRGRNKIQGGLEMPLLLFLQEA